jgi:hypothetical protein
MAVDIENVQKLMGWLAQDSPARSTVAAAETLVGKLAAVVFQGDAQWTERSDQADSHRDTLSAWFAGDTDSGSEQQFATMTTPDAGPGMFVDWFLPVVTRWESQAAGQQSADGWQSPAVQGNGSSSAAGSGRYSEPARDDGYGLTYRYDHHGGGYEWYDEAGQTWQDQAWADQHAAAGPGSADRSAAAATASAAATTPGADASAGPAPVWDENWKMFYRVDAGGAYQFADAVTPGDRASGSGGTWLSQEQAAARAAGEHHPASATDPAATDPNAAAADALHNSMLAAVESAFEADPSLKVVLTDEHIKAVLADVAQELIR